MVVYGEINIQGSSINKTPYSTISVTLCTGTSFAKKYPV